MALAVPAAGTPTVSPISRFFSPRASSLTLSLLAAPSSCACAESSVTSAGAALLDRRSLGPAPPYIPPFLGSPVRTLVSCELLESAQSSTRTRKATRRRILICRAHLLASSVAPGAQLPRACHSFLALPEDAVHRPRIAQGSLVQGTARRQPPCAVEATQSRSPGGDIGHSTRAGVSTSLVEGKAASAEEGAQRQSSPVAAQEEFLNSAVQDVEEKVRLELSSTSMGSAEEVIPGTEHEVILQAFNWESHKASSPSWWAHLTALVPELQALKITSVWLPPPSASLAPQGYIPQDLYCLDSAYGTEAELRELLKQLQEANIGAVADLVVNHRAGSGQDEEGQWTRYPGLRPDWDERAVTSDTGGKGSASTGTVFNGIANIDHTQEFVRRDLKDWMLWLKDNVGFSSFRFDYAKGYSAGFAREYLEAVRPHLTVGEYWDDCSYSGEDYALDYDQDRHRQRIVDWIDGTGGQSAAFDFTTKAILQEAVKSKQWSRLRDGQGRAPGLLGFWPSRAVTFIDNHDTGSTQAHWPFPREYVLQGYAYILTHPGIPAIFYDHLLDWGEEVKSSIMSLLKARTEANVSCNSELSILQADSNSYVAQVGAKLVVQIGASDWASQNMSSISYALVAEGNEVCNYAVWMIGDRNTDSV